MNRMKILVVDDETEFTEGLSKVLRRRGMEVRAVSSAAQALSLFSEEAFDLVILDVKMPGMGGLEALSEIKRIAPGTEVILMTGHLSPSEEEEGIRGGALAYLIKPYPIPDLVALIQETARRQQKEN